jgi:hypothetical protein
MMLHETVNKKHVHQVSVPTVSINVISLLEIVVGIGVHE